MDHPTLVWVILKKNIEKQKGIYELFSEDKINLALYKDRAELLSNEEKKLKQDIKAIQQIVKFELNEPWKTCYEEGVKWLKTSEKTTIQAIPEANPSTPLRTGARRSYVCFCAPSGAR